MHKLHKSGKSARLHKAREGYGRHIVVAMAAGGSDAHVRVASGDEFRFTQFNVTI